MKTKELKQWCKLVVCTTVQTLQEAVINKNTENQTTKHKLMRRLPYPYHVTRARDTKRVDYYIPITLGAKSSLNSHEYKLEQVVHSSNNMLSKRTAEKSNYHED